MTHKPPPTPYQLARDAIAMHPDPLLAAFLYVEALNQEKADELWHSLWQQAPVSMTGISILFGVECDLAQCLSDKLGMGLRWKHYDLKRDCMGEGRYADG